MDKLINLLLYGGIEKEIYDKVSYRASGENKKAINVFSVVGAAAMIFSAILALVKDMSVPVASYFGFAGVFILMLILNNTLARKNPKVSDICAILYSVSLLMAGVLIAYSQYDERTTMLLPLFSLVALVFCYRPIYLVLIIAGTEIAYLVLMKGVQSESLYYVNKVNTLIFSSIGLISGLYALSLKYKRFKSEYENQILIEKDVLTGLYNRHSYNSACEKIKGLKKPVAICSFDINGLKQINDTKGHQAGDELIRGAASCIFDVFAPYGDIYRIGGDEFCAIIYQDFDIDAARREFESKTKSWKGKQVDDLSVAMGVAKLDHDFEDRLNEVINEADAQMYSHKKAYYDEHGIKR